MLFVLASLRPVSPASSVCVYGLCVGDFVAAVCIRGGVWLLNYGCAISDVFMYVVISG